MKPVPKIAAGPEIAKQKRLRDEAKEARESEEKRVFHEERNSLIEKVVESNEKIAESIEIASKNTDLVNSELLSSLREEIAKIRLEIPVSEDGDKISRSLSESTEKIEKSLEILIKTISKIKLEVKETDLKPHTDAITKTITKNFDSLKTSIEELTNSVKEINFEQPLVMLSYKVERDDSGYIKTIHPIAPEYLNG